MDIECNFNFTICYKMSCGQTCNPVVNIITLERSIGESISLKRDTVQHLYMGESSKFPKS